MNESISSFLAIPWKRDGRGFDGADCWGLVMLWYRHKLGIEFPDYAAMKYQPGMFGSARKRSIFIDHVAEYFVPVELPQLQPNDILLIRNGPSVVNHLGVAVDSFRFLHVTENSMAVVTRVSAWRKKIAGVYRHKDLLNANQNHP